MIHILASPRTSADVTRPSRVQSIVNTSLSETLTGEVFKSLEEAEEEAGRAEVEGAAVVAEDGC